MAMTLDSMTNLAMLNRNIASTGIAADPVTRALGAASQRIGEQLSSTQVRLSSYGQIQSGFASLQTTGKALGTLAKDATVSDIGKAAQNFVNAFNTTATAVNTAISGSGKSPGTLANDSLARIANNDLRRVVPSGTGVAALKDIGISIARNSTLSVDTKALEKAAQANPDAVKNTLANLGQQAALTATRELSSSGAVGSSVNSLSNRARNLATQQQQQESLGALAQSAIQQHADLTSNTADINAGIGAYMKMFSL